MGLHVSSGAPPLAKDVSRVSSIVALVLRSLVSSRRNVKKLSQLTISGGLYAKAVLRLHVGVGGNLTSQPSLGSCLASHPNMYVK